jgi:hypothetical protein
VKVKSTLTLGVGTALSAVVLLGVPTEFPMSQACAQQAKSTGVSFAEDIAPILRPYLNTYFLQATDFAGNLAKFGATWHYASQNRIFALYIGFSTALATRFG